MTPKIVITLVIVVAIGVGIAGFLYFKSNNDAPRGTLPENPEVLSEPQYLAFQIFTRGHGDSSDVDIEDQVSDIIQKVGSTGTSDKILAFIPGPLALDDTDEKVQTIIRDSFSIALEKNIAVGFHIDDSMFWGRLSHLGSAENVEWLDWNKTPSTGRRLDWSSTPTKIESQLCFNSRDVKAEVKKRSDLIGREVKRGMGELSSAGKSHLFAGVIAGWETQIGRDFDTGGYLGYCALTNKGFSETNLPKDMNEARADVVKEFIDFWASSLADAGVSEDKIYSHISFLSRGLFDSAKASDPSRFPNEYLETIGFTPPRIAFGSRHRPGFSTYPQPELLDEIAAEREKNGNPPWASAEGTAVDPGAAERGEDSDSMETYLGNMFNYGAAIVNIFGWGVGDSNNPFRRVAESKNAIEAYRKFLRGETLKAGARSQAPSPQFSAKVENLSEKLPTYIKEYGTDNVEALYDTFNQQLKEQRFIDAEKTIDEILSIIET